MPIHLSPLIKCVLSLSLGLHSHWSLLFPGAHHLSPCISLTQFQCILHTVAIITSPPQFWSCHSFAFQALVAPHHPPVAWYSMTFHTLTSFLCSPSSTHILGWTCTHLHHCTRLRLHVLVYVTQSLGPPTFILPLLYLAHFLTSSLHLLFEIFLQKHTK